MKLKWYGRKELVVVVFVTEHGAWQFRKPIHSTRHSFKGYLYGGGASAPATEKRADLETGRPGFDSGLDAVLCVGLLCLKHNYRE